MAKSTKINNNKKGSTQNPINMADKSANVEVVSSTSENWEEAYVEKLKEFDQMVNFKSLVGALDTFTRVSTLVEIISDEATSNIDDDNIKTFVNKCDTVLDDDIYVAGQNMLTDALEKHCRIAKTKSDRLKSMAIIKAVLAMLEKDGADVIIIKPVYETLVTYANTMSNINEDDAKMIAVSLLLNGILIESIKIAEKHGLEIIVQEGEDTMEKNNVNVDEKGAEEMSFKDVVAAPDVAVADESATTAAEEVGGVVSSLSNEVYSRLAPAWKSIYAGREDELATAINKVVALKMDTVSGSELKDSDKFIDKYLGDFGDGVNEIMTANKAAEEAGETLVLEGDNDALIGKVVMACLFDAIAENRQAAIDKMVALLPEKYWSNVASYIPEELKGLLKDVKVKEARDAVTNVDSSIRASMKAGVVKYATPVIESAGLNGDGKELSRHIAKTASAILTSKRGEGVRSMFSQIKDQARNLLGRVVSIWENCDEKPEVVEDKKSSPYTKKADSVDEMMEKIRARLAANK